jgi:hypothetical protein
MLCLTRPRTCTRTNMYHPYRKAVSSNTLSSFECFIYQVAPVFDIETLTETYPMCPEGEEVPRFVLGAQDGHAASVTEM